MFYSLFFLFTLTNVVFSSEHLHEKEEFHSKHEKVNRMEHKKKSPYPPSSYPNYPVVSAGSKNVKFDVKTAIDTSKFFATWAAVDGSGASAEATVQLTVSVPTSGSFFVQNVIESVIFHLHKPNGETVTYTTEFFENSIIFYSSDGLDFSQNLMGQSIAGGTFGGAELTDFNFLSVGVFWFIIEIGGYELEVTSVCAAGSSCYVGGEGTPCSLTSGSAYSHQVAQLQAVSTSKLLQLNGSRIICENAECIPYLSTEAARSLNKIVSDDDNLNKEDIILEYAFAGVVEEYWLASFSQIAANPLCTNRQLKNLFENPITDSHFTGCAIDLTPSSVALWAHALIEKGWAYTRPTLDKHHFEFLKCKHLLTWEENAEAFGVLFEANGGDSFDHSDHSAVFNAISTLEESGEFGAPIH